MVDSNDIRYRSTNISSNTFVSSVCFSKSIMSSHFLIVSSLLSAAISISSILLVTKFLFSLCVPTRFKLHPFKCFLRACWHPCHLSKEYDCALNLSLNSDHLLETIKSKPSLCSTVLGRKKSNFVWRHHAP